MCSNSNFEKWIKTFTILLCNDTIKLYNYHIISWSLFKKFLVNTSIHVKNWSITLQQRNYRTATLPLQRNCYILCARVNLKVTKLQCMHHQQFCNNAFIKNFQLHWNINLQQCMIRVETNSRQSVFGSSIDMRKNAPICKNNPNFHLVLTTILLKNLSKNDHKKVLFCSEKAKNSSSWPLNGQT